MIQHVKPRCPNSKILFDSVPHKPKWLFLQIKFYQNISRDLNFSKWFIKVLEQFGDLLIKPFWNMSKKGRFGKVRRGVRFCLARPTSLVEGVKGRTLKIPSQTFFNSHFHVDFKNITSYYLVKFFCFILNQTPEHSEALTANTPSAVLSTLILE